MTPPLILITALAVLPSYGQLTTEPTPKINAVGAGFNLDWHGQLSRGYFIQCSDDLINWSYMPVIEHGADAAIGYGFNSPDQRLFLRLKYTDDAVTDPWADDYDGDGISNWNEVRAGGTGTDPFLGDSTGNGQSDYHADSNSNGMPDGWEATNGNLGDLDPNGNDDDDTLTNLEESLMGSDPLLGDTDGDNVKDGAEAIWWDPSITEWPRSREVRYAVIELDSLGVNTSASYVDNLNVAQAGGIHSTTQKNEWTIQVLSNDGHVLVVEDHRGPSGALGKLNPSTISGSIKNHIWDFTTASWVVLKNDKAGGSGQDALAVANSVSADGKATGYGWIPLADINGDPTGGPGVERVVMKWSDLEANTVPSMETQLNGNAHATFSSDNDNLEVPFYAEGLSISDTGGILHVKVGASGVALKLAGVTVANDTTFQSNFPGTQMTGQKDVLYKDPVTGDYQISLADGNTSAIVHGAQKPSVITAVARIDKHNDDPANINIVALDNNVWARNNNSWKKVLPHPVLVLTGGKGVSDDFTVLLNDGKTIMRNGKYLTVSDLADSSTWSDFRMEKMNDKGMMVGRAKKDNQDEVVLLLPVDIVPDYNRDGMIDDDDAGKATEEEPYIFWVNDDDDDNTEPEIADIPGTDVDNADMIVNGERDLVDFFPVQLRIKKLLELFPSATHDYKISHPTGAFHFIEMPTIQPDSQRESTGAGSYLANETMAQFAMGQPMNDTAGQGTALTEGYLAAIENGMGVLIFESTEETNQSFELIVTKKQGGNTRAHIKDVLKMKTKKVENLYWRANIRPAAYNQPVPAIVPASEQKHIDILKDRWFVFCHGYNVSEQNARGWNAEMFKRMTQMGFQSKFLAVSWEGNQGQISGIVPLIGGATPDYWHNIYNAFRSSSHLASLVNGLSGGEVVIAGHSMGNMLVSSAICNHGGGSLNAENYFMLNAAVARGAYSASHVATDRSDMRHPTWQNHATRLWSTDYWKLFEGTQDNRKKLTWQSQFSSLGSKTSPHNYYSSGEDVLMSGDGVVPNLLSDVTIRSQQAWVKQEMGKGTFTKKLVTGTHTANGGWTFNSFWNGTPPATNTPLIANPFFKPFTLIHDANGQNPQSIHGANGSNLANDYLIRSFLLGHDLPALTNPAGSNPIYEGNTATEHNTDMHVKLRTGTWGDWHHSDLKNQPMDYVWKVHADMVKRGKLNKTFNPPSTD